MGDNRFVDVEIRIDGRTIHRFGAERVETEQTAAAPTLSAARWSPSLLTLPLNPLLAEKQPPPTPIEITHDHDADIWTLTRAHVENWSATQRIAAAIALLVLQCTALATLTLILIGAAK